MQGAVHTLEFWQVREEEQGSAQDEVRCCYKARWLLLALVVAGGGGGWREGRAGDCREREQRRRREPFPVVLRQHLNAVSVCRQPVI